MVAINIARRASEINGLFDCIRWLEGKQNQFPNPSSYAPQAGFNQLNVPTLVFRFSKLAALASDRDHLIAESADLLFHILVLLKSRSVPLSDVEAALSRRKLVSGLEEKAARKNV